MPDQDETIAHHPDLKDVPKDKGLFCFMDHDRVCGADCMAFQATRPEGNDYVAQQWAQCMLLTNAHKVGKHTQIIAIEMMKKNKDAARTGQQPPPLPTMPKKPGT